jgi:hypothetical protein
MGDLRDKMDLAAGKADAHRAAQAGGPRFIARSPGRARGADHFPRTSRTRAKRKR